MIGLVGSASAISLLLVAAALAYTHQWSGTAGTSVRIYDLTGQTYNPWQHMRAAASSNGGSVSQTCVKGIRQSGTVYQFSCVSGNGAIAYGCRSDAGNTLAYMYWEGTGSTGSMDGKANTDYIC